MPPKIKKPRPTRLKPGPKPNPAGRYIPAHVKLPPEHAEYARAIGSGSVSRGVKLIVERSFTGLIPVTGNEAEKTIS